MAKASVKIAVLTMGVSGIVAELLLLRELFIVFSGNELSIGIILANWLILEAFGCFILGRKAEKIKEKIPAFAGVTIIFSLLFPVAIYFVRILKNILGVSIGESIGLFPMFYSSFLIILPVSVSHGALFSLSCNIYSTYIESSASSVGRVYVYETFGTILGGILWTYFLIVYLHAFQIAIGLALVNFLVLLILLFNYRTTGRKYRFTMAFSLFLLIFSAYLFISGKVDKIHHHSIRTQWKNHNVVCYKNSIYGNISVIKSGEQYIFFYNGIPELIIPIPDIGFVEKFAHLPLLAHPHPEKLLIIGAGAGGLIDEILKHKCVKLIEYAELDPYFLRLIRKYSTPLTEKELKDPRVKIRYMDGRLMLKITQKRYDVIMVGILNPSDLQANRLFTKEFFTLVKRKLNKDGILTIGLPGSLSYLNDELRNLNSCIYNTLREVFPHIRVFPGEGLNLFLSSCSKNVLRLDEGQIVEGLKERNIKVNVLIARHIKKALHPGWQGWFLNFIKRGSKKINHDFRPLGVFYSISHWNSLFAPYLCGLFRWIEKINLWFFVLLTLIWLSLVFIPKAKPFGSGIPLCIGTTGLAGMIFDLAIIFTFQSIYGYVFSWMGILVTSFMVGVATGAMSITSLLLKIKKCFKVFIDIELAIMGFSILLPLLFYTLHPYLDVPKVSPLMMILFLILSFIGGVLIGAQFPLANRIYISQKKSLTKTAGILYSSDLVGGWLGGMIGGALLLPILGLLGSCFVVFLIKLCSFIYIKRRVK